MVKFKCQQKFYEKGVFYAYKVIKCMHKIRLEMEMEEIQER